MKKLFFSALVMLFLISSTIAQTNGQYTLWSQNHYLVNPAAAGNQDFFDGAIGYRKQWAGIKEAPKTIYAVAHTVLNRPKTYQRSAIRMSNTTSQIYRRQKSMRKPMTKHAVGVQLFSNQQGAFGRTEALLSYALHLPIYKDLSLSFGLSGGLNSFSFDESQATVINEVDPVYNAYINGENSNQFNVNSGIYLYSDLFFVGYSANQLLQNDLKIADIETTSEQSNLEIQHNIIGGYNFDLTNDFRLTPSLIVKYTAAKPLSFEGGANLSYKQAINVGLSYRSDDALSVILGARLNHILKMGYAYDYTLSELSGSVSGSHELFIGFTLY